MSEAPGTGGSYCLVLRVVTKTCLQIGKLGEFAFPPGIYAYFGSARGPGGLKARLRHHLHPASKPHWHIDWLRMSSLVEGVWWSTAAGLSECDWLQALLPSSRAAVLVKGFGSSDCVRGCPTHLLFFGTMKAQPNWRRTFEEEFYSRLPGLVPYLGFYHCA